MNAEYFESIVQDARVAHRLFESMRTEELLVLQAAHTADLADATTPEGIAFGGSRLALIAAVLKTRKVPPSITCPICQRTSYHPRDISERYCGACHRFHDEMSGTVRP